MPDVRTVDVRSTEYRPDIDCLRAFAVSSVMSGLAHGQGFAGASRAAEDVPESE